MGEGREAKGFAGRGQECEELKQKQGPCGWLGRTEIKELASPSGRWQEKVP